MPATSELNTGNTDVNTLRMDSLTSPRPTWRGTSQFSGQHVHFIGIGGCGMSGLASILLDADAVVTGSEPHFNTVTGALVKRGATVSRDQMGELLSGQVNLVVRSAAIKDDNDEYIAARALKIPIVKYAEMLGMIMEERYGVAVAGTHGKSTTTGMISYALIECGADPSFVVGGTVTQLKAGSRSGKGAAFVAEACEFDRSFHNLHPSVALITNVEEDHLDCYKDIHDIINSFRVFAGRVPADGLIIANGQDANVAAALKGINCTVQTVGLNDPTMYWNAHDISRIDGRYSAEISLQGCEIGTLRLALAGKHNLFNGIMALAACHSCGINLNRAIEAIGRFTGVDRRMTEMGRCKTTGALVIDDYGHHPTEIQATLKAVQEKYQPRRLFCVFQPHQHSRTRFLLNSFAKSFEAADETIVPDIYFVRDSAAEEKSISAIDLVKRIVANGQRAAYIPEREDIKKYLRQHAQEADVILTLGAGDVWTIGKDLVND